MEKPIININIKNLIGTLVIIGDNKDNNELNKIVTETLNRVINSVAEIQQEVTIQDLKDRDKEYRKDFENYKNIKKDNL